jgi:hypothetical protein
MSNGNLKNTIQEYQESSFNMNVFIFFYFLNFHTESSKIIKYGLKNFKIKKYTLKNLKITKYAKICTIDMFFVVSSNEFLAHLAINPIVQKKHANTTTSEPYL